LADSTPALAMQFDDLHQQREAADFGMWIFLATEIMFFGGMFLGYTLYRIQYEEAFAEASHHANLLLGTLNTAILLTSSLFMALSVHFAQQAKRTAVVVNLIITILLGLVFLALKFLEYYQHYQDYLVPAPGLGIDFRWENEAQKPAAAMYFTLYFLMTGFHALHMTIGVGLLIVLTVLAWQGHLLGTRSTPVHVSGLYWHFVDIVWIFLYPFLYLMGARGG
jgi:cytochrome c oxidase subunit 3